MIEKNILKELYINKNFTRKQVAEELRVSERQVKAYLLKYQIKKPLELKKEHFTGGHTTGLLWWTDGISETCAKDCPGDGWIRGRSEEAKKNQVLAAKTKVFSEEGKAKLRQIGKLRKGTHLSEEARQKISEYWKTHDHPFKGKHRDKETCEKISKTLVGHLQAAPKREVIEALTYTQCVNYLTKDLIINFQQIYEDLNITDNEDSWQQIQKHFDILGVTYKKYTSCSLTEKEILDFIKSIYAGEILENYKKALDNYEIDIFVPEFNLGIEYNGIYWHRSNYKKIGNKFIFDSGKNPDYHQKKSLLAREKGIRLIHIWEDQWKDERLQPILKGILKAALHVSNLNRIPARKCILKELDAKTYRDFCDKHHTQLSRPAEIRLGLFYNDELVQVASFSKYRALNKSKTDIHYDYEFVRGCEDFNHSSVNGGVSKLLAYFIKTYNPKSIICYSDLNLFNGIGYEKAGFKLDSITNPDKFYVTWDRQLKRIKRSAKNYQKYMNSVINKELFCCYGAGNLKYIWKPKDFKV